MTPLVLGLTILVGGALAIVVGGIAKSEIERLIAARRMNRYLHPVHLRRG